jgi:hypothetical protein
VHGIPGNKLGSTVTPTESLNSRAYKSYVTPQPLVAGGLPGEEGNVGRNLILHLSSFDIHKETITKRLERKPQPGECLHGRGRARGGVWKQEMLSGPHVLIHSFIQQIFQQLPGLGPRVHAGGLTVH